jgi:hypothetical protein
MTFRSLALIIVIYSSFAAAQGRRPAVEDFVGIEVEESKVAPQGTESLYNLEQDLQKIETNKNKPDNSKTKFTTQSKTLSGMATLGISLILGLPLVVWYLVMSHFKKQASIESASNIAVLEKYRQEREKKSEENIKRAS